MIAVRSAVAPVAHAFDDVVDGDAGLADLLLERLADARRPAHQVAGSKHAHVLHRHVAVLQRGQRSLGGEVDGVDVGMLPELRHLDAEDVDVVAGHGYASRGSKPKPMASVPSSSVPTV